MRKKADLTSQELVQIHCVSHKQHAALRFAPSQNSTSIRQFHAEFVSSNMLLDACVSGISLHTLCPFLYASHDELFQNFLCKEEEEEKSISKSVEN